MTFKVSTNILFLDPEGERITKKGFLTKQGGFVPTWKRRWYVQYECILRSFLILVTNRFVLDNLTMSYYEGEIDSIPLGTIHLKQYGLLQHRSLLFACLLLH